MNTEPIKNCPKCQAPVPPEAPQGLCPKCLLAAVSNPTEAGQARETQSIPALETIRSNFPQLDIIEFVGQGGMGLVYKARQRHLDRWVALKLLPHKDGADPSTGERFNREARVLARLSHPNIVAVHDFGRVDRYFYLLMEFVDGVNLRQAMRAGRFTPAQALALVPKICDALQYAHEEGVLHRDIKPENLLLDTRGRVKIADFGIAKLLGETKDVTLTASGAALGTPHYMAPEQLESPQDVDQRADIFSLGVVFYEMLTGELPIGRFAPPSEKASVDPRVDQVVLRALEKERERRFQSAGEVKTRVENITANPSVAGPQVSSNEARESTATRVLSEAVTSRPHHTRRRLLASFSLVGLSLFGGILALGVMAGGDVRPPAVLFLLVLIAVPASAGTFLAWSLLQNTGQPPLSPRARWLARLAALFWPVLICDAALFLTLLLAARNVEVYVLRFHNAALTVLCGIAGAVGLAALNWTLIREWTKRWRLDPTANPLSDVRMHLRRFPRSAVWTSMPLLLIAWLLLLRGAVRSERQFEPPETIRVTQPAPPPGYAVPTGLSPGDNWSYHSGFAVPAGYVLTLTTTLWSNQVPVKSREPNSVFIISPAGRETRASLAWKLIGNAALADGAPLAFSAHLDERPEEEVATFHVVTPEPVAVNWVSAPAQLWPPENGHTRFVIVKGTGVENRSSRPEDQSDSTAEAPHQPAATDSAAEWAVGIESRVDPIPSQWLHRLNNAQVGLGTNWSAAFVEAGSESAETDRDKPESPSGNP